MRYEAHSEIDIDASPETVWEILTDLDRYADWNPFVVSSEGQVAVGERLTNRMHPPGGKAMTFSPTVTVSEPNHVFEWLGHLGVRGSSTVAIASRSARRRRAPTWTRASTGLPRGLVTGWVKRPGWPVGS